MSGEGEISLRGLVPSTGLRRGVYSLSCMAVVEGPSTVASLQCRKGARRVFTGLEDIACTPSTKRYEGGFFRSSLSVLFLLFWREGKGVGWGGFCLSSAAGPPRPPPPPSSVSLPWPGIEAD